MCNTKEREKEQLRAVSSGLCKEVTFQLRSVGFPESDEEKNWEGFHRQRGHMCRASRWKESCGSQPEGGDGCEPTDKAGSLEVMEMASVKGVEKATLEAMGRSVEFNNHKILDGF